jgi:hypothetical protein
MEAGLRSMVRIPVMLLLTAALLTACGGAATPERDPVELMLTDGVLTLVAGHFQTQTALVPPASATAPSTATPGVQYTPLGAASPVLSPSVSPTWVFHTPTLGTPLTPSVTGTVFTNTPDPAALAFGCNNLAFVRDVSIPAGTPIQPGADFRKTWKVANTGTCNWMYQFAVAFAGGNAMGGKITKLGRMVTVSDWAELSVSMTAPTAPGTYTGYWRLQTAEGQPFGATLVVSVTVSNPTDTPNPPSATPLPTETPTPTSTDTPEPTATEP